MASVRNLSFSGGEISPSLYSRVDQVRYATGLKTCRNFMVARHGGAYSRPGTKFVGEIKDSDSTVRLIPFIFNSSQTYVLEFGDLYMRVIRDGAQVTLTAQNITAISNANPAVITYSGSDTYANGDEVYISGVVGNIAPFINGRNFLVANVNAGANTFEITYLDGTNVDSTSWGTWTSGGTVAEIYQITTPYAVADLPTLQYAQSGDVVTLVHPSYAPRELSRTAHTTWTLSTITFSPDTARPTGATGTAGGAGANTYRYVVTAISAETAEESLGAKNTTTSTISAITQANPAVVTYVGADVFANGDTVLIDGVVGMTEVNELEFIVANVNTGANTFELKNTNSTSYTAYSSGGNLNRVSIVVSAAAAPSGGAPHALSWTTASGISEYNIYKESDGVYGFIGVSADGTFDDTGLTPDTTINPPRPRLPFKTSGNYPSTVSYFQQRRLFANTNNNPETVYASRTGAYSNFTVSSPLQDDDAVTFTLAGRQVNQIKSLIELGTPITFTSAAEVAIQGNEAGILLPTAVNPKQYSANGSGDLPPIIVSGSAVYLQARGSIVRDLAFDYQVDGYRGNDLTIFSSHLFEGHTIEDWAFSQIPHSIIWAVRDDGTLLGCTYIREHQIVGWHRHDFENGTVENVCVVPEDDEDILYLVVKRTVDGATKRYIERMATRKVDDIEDYIGLDSSLTYDGENTTATTMTLSGGTNWTFDETLTLTASVTYFTAADIGNAIYIESATGSVIRFTITGCSGTFALPSATCTGTPHMTVPANLRSTARTTWTRAVDQVTGLWHLEGETVSVFADGFVAASPNNAAYTTVTVADGVATLDRPYGLIHVGLPITCDLETLNIDSVQSETLADKKKLISRVTMFVESSRGIWVGAETPPDEDTDFLGGLYELKQRDTEGYDDPVALATGTVDVNIQPQWNSSGAVFCRQIDPIPLAVLSIIPSGLIPFRG